MCNIIDGIDSFAILESENWIVQFHLLGEIKHQIGKSSNETYLLRIFWERFPMVWMHNVPITMIIQ